jgi:CPA1 family monovalent cation:H+ antiporter
VRVRVVAAQRKALLEMRSRYEIGDDAFHQIEAQLDVAEVSAQGAEYP